MPEVQWAAVSAEAGVEPEAVAYEVADAGVQAAAGTAGLGAGAKREVGLGSIGKRMGHGSRAEAPIFYYCTGEDC